MFNSNHSDIKTRSRSTPFTSQPHSPVAMEGLENRRAKMRAVNPAFIPRNHRIEEVIEAAVVAADFTPFEALLLVLAKPFEDQPAFAHYMDPPQVHERVCQTFCGT